MDGGGRWEGQNFQQLKEVQRLEEEEEELSEIWSKMYVGIYVKCPLFLSDFNKTLIFSTDFRKIPKYQILLKSVWWELRYSMQIHMTKLIVAFRNFENAP